MVVVSVLAALAGLVIVSLGGERTQTAAEPGALDAAQMNTTRFTLAACRDAIVGRSHLGGGAPRPGYLADMGAPPNVIADLLRLPSGASGYDPLRHTGWRGPYVKAPLATFEPDATKGLSSIYGQPGDPAIADGFGGPVVLQVPDVESDGVVSATERKHGRLVSPGPDRILETPRDALFPPQSACGDDVVLYLHVADLRPPS